MSGVSVTVPISGIKTAIFTSSGTWTCPSSITQAVVFGRGGAGGGGGGGSGANAIQGCGGGGGGAKVDTGTDGGNGANGQAGSDGRIIVMWVS